MLLRAGMAVRLRGPVNSTLGITDRPGAAPVAAVSGILIAMKVAEVLRMLLDDGWFLAAQKGSHRQFKHPVKPGRVTVPGKPSDDLAAGTLNSILKQAGLKQ